MSFEQIWLMTRQSTSAMGQIQTMVGETGIPQTPIRLHNIISLKVLWKFTVKSSKYWAMCRQIFRPNCAAMISLWNTFNRTFWVFNVTKLSDWCKQEYLIQTNSALSLCECVRFLYTKPGYVDYYPDKPFKLWHSIYILSSKSTSWWYVYNVCTE